MLCKYIINTAIAVASDHGKLRKCQLGQKSQQQEETNKLPERLLGQSLSMIIPYNVSCFSTLVFERQTDNYPKASIANYKIK